MANIANSMTRRAINTNSGDDITGLLRALGGIRIAYQHAMHESFDRIMLVTRIQIKMSVPHEPALRQKMKYTGGRSAILVAVVALIMSGCMALSGRCIYETRALTVNGKLARGPGDTVSVLLNLGEQRDTDPNKGMNWGIHGPSLKVHVLSVTLRDNTDPSRVLFTFPLTTNGRPAISEGDTDQKQGANLDGVFDRLAEGRGFVRIETNLPGQATIDIPLTVSSKQDWSRPYCS